MRLKFTMTSALATAASLMLSHAALAQAAQTFDEVVAKAKEEGALFIAISSPGVPEGHQALIKAFNERFGLNLRIEWTPTNPVQTGTRLIAEAGAAGSVDIVGNGGPQEVMVLKDRDIVKPYPWAEVFGNQLNGFEEIANRPMEDLRGYVLPIVDVAYGISWNPNLIADEEVPSSWAELFDPKWKGKFSVNSLALNPLDYYTFAVGKDATLEMAEKTLDNEPVLERGTAAATRAVAIGQVPVGLSAFHIAQRTEGVKFKLFDDYVALNHTFIYVPETAPNPNAARLFAAWLVSEGMSVVEEFEKLPRAADVGSPLAKMVEDAKAKGAKILEEDSLANSSAAAETRAEISDMLTNR